MSQEEHDKRIDYVEFASTDMEGTKLFYSSVFGWKFTDWGPEYVSFEDGRLTGGFLQADDIEAGGPLVVIYAKNLSEVEESVKANGGLIVKETFSFPGGRRFHFADPSGNVLAVWSDLESVEQTSSHVSVRVPGRSSRLSGRSPHRSQ
jgi:predicted enzyme related to lactoylglutathione lyase